MAVTAQKTPDPFAVEEPVTPPEGPPTPEKDVFDVGATGAQPNVTEAVRKLLEVIRTKYPDSWPAAIDGQKALYDRLTAQVSYNFGSTKEQLDAYVAKLAGDQAALGQIAADANKTAAQSAPVRRDYQGDAARLVDAQLLQATGRVDPEVRSKVMAFIPQYFKPGVDPARAYQAFAANLDGFAEDQFDAVMEQRFDEAWDDGKQGGWFAGLSLSQKSLPQDSFIAASWKIALAGVQAQKASLKDQYLADLKTYNPGSDGAMDHRVVSDTGYIFSPQEFLRLRAPSVLDTATGGIASARPAIKTASSDITTIMATTAMDVYRKQDIMGKALKLADQRLAAAQRALQIPAGQIGPDVPEWASLQRTRDSLANQEGQLVYDYAHDLNGYRGGIDPLAYLDLQAPGRMLFDHLGDPNFVNSVDITFAGTVNNVLRNAAAPRLAKEQAVQAQNVARYTAEAQKRIGKVSGDEKQFDPASYLASAGGDPAIALDNLDRDLFTFKQDTAATTAQAKQDAATKQAQSNFLSTAGRLAPTTLKGGAGAFTPTILQGYVTGAGGDLVTAMNNFQIDLDQARDKEKEAALATTKAQTAATTRQQWLARTASAIDASDIDPSRKPVYQRDLAALYDAALAGGLDPDQEFAQRIARPEDKLAVQKGAVVAEYKAKAGFMSRGSQLLQKTVNPGIFHDMLGHLDLGSMYDSAKQLGQNPDALLTHRLRGFGGLYGQSMTTELAAAQSQGTTPEETAQLLERFGKLTDDVNAGLPGGLDLPGPHTGGHGFPGIPIATGRSEQKRPPVQAGAA